MVPVLTCDAGGCFCAHVVSHWLRPECCTHVSLRPTISLWSIMLCLKGSVVENETAEATLVRVGRRDSWAVRWGNERAVKLRRAWEVGALTPKVQGRHAKTYTKQVSVEESLLLGGDGSEAQQRWRIGSGGTGAALSQLRRGQTPSSSSQWGQSRRPQAHAAAQREGRKSSRGLEYAALAGGARQMQKQ
jgi:hypothetical protein